jgi:predicted unusual protein kinase regulating ubiquinone biosynthesis (AarF/ABC1/UbiB family)
MPAKTPTGKVGRALSGGRTAARVGTRVLAYYAKRPFLSQEGRHQAREAAARQGAQALFQGLSLLRGTALKMAQQLSLEMDLLPEAACRELSKAYHQVPPINRALVRKAIRCALGGPPERMFKRFDLDAFAAASLGQVHWAVTHDNRPLAVKIQYPGIARTIDSDVALLKQLLRPVVKGEDLMPTLNEVAQRLREEVDYLQEAEHLQFFAGCLDVRGVRIPCVDAELSSATVLSTALMPGKPLDLWLQGNPGQRARDEVARKLDALFVQGLYELNAIHADPNPGNFIIADDLTIGLVDFGCIKRLTPEFVEHYRKLALAAAHHEEGAHYAQMIALGFVPPDLAPEVAHDVRRISDEVGRWFGRLFRDDVFDFGQHAGFIAEGKQVMRRFHHLRRHLRINPDMIFLDRTRYGLLRIFEMLGARVRFRNPYEW